MGSELELSVKGQDELERLQPHHYVWILTSTIVLILAILIYYLSK